MKKFLLGIFILIGVGAAALTESGALAAEASALVPITLYDPNTCEPFQCDSPTKPISCEGLVVGSCSGTTTYTGTLRRN